MKMVTKQQFHAFLAPKRTDPRELDDGTNVGVTTWKSDNSPETPTDHKIH